MNMSEHVPLRSDYPELVMRYETFDDKISELKQYASQNETITLWEITSLFGHSSLYVLIALMAVPFLQPIPLIGFSTIFGTIVIITGLFIVAGAKLFLPDRIKRIALKQKSVLKMCKGAETLSIKMKMFIRPRGRFMLRHTLVRKVTGVFISYCGLLLSLPIPLPGTNTFPALAIFIMALASLEEDGITLMLGYFVAVVATFYIWFVVIKPIEYILK